MIKKIGFLNGTGLLSISAMLICFCLVLSSFLSIYSIKDIDSVNENIGSNNGATADNADIVNGYQDMFINSNTRAVEALDGISQWDATVLATFEDKTSGCTIGDLDLTRDGNEIVTVNGDGLVAMIYQSKAGDWKTVELWQGQGELITPVIGNFYPEHDGNELLVVGMAIGPEAEVGAGQATMIWGSGNNWDSAVIYLAPNMLHGAAVGDLDPNHDGAEVIVMSFGFDVEMLTWNGTEPDEWTVTHMWHAEGKVRKGFIDDVDPSHDGNELVVVDKSGNCTMLYGSGTIWTVKHLWLDPGPPGLARVTRGEVDSAYPGKEIVVGGDSHNVGLIWREGDNWKGKVIFTDSDSIRGVGIGDVDPTNKGNEILVFGYSQNVTLLTKKGDTWKSRGLFTDTGRSHDLAIGECDPTHDGLEIVIAGYSKNITMIGVTPWIYKVLSSYDDKTSGCTIGDLDLSRDGNEIVTVNGDGLVSMVYQTPSGEWKALKLWQGQGELITPVIGDFYPKNDGNELLVAGMAIGPEAEVGAGQATMIYGKGDNWDYAVIYLAPNMLHGAAVGDLDPTRDGDEIIVMSFGFDVELLTWNGTEPDEWTVTHMWHGEGKVRKGIIDDLDPNHEGNELVVVDKSGNCTMLYGSGTNWTAKTLWTDPGEPGLARVAVGEVDTTIPGKEIIVGGDSNNVGIIWRTGTTWDGEIIFTDSDKIRGIGIGDVDPKNTGNEILIFGYSQDVNLLIKKDDTWQSEVIFTDTGRSHDLALGEAYTAHQGQELIIAGYSKNITMIYNIGSTEAADFNLYAYPTTQTAFSGSSVEFNIGVISLGGLNSPVKFTTSGLPENAKVKFYPATVIPDSTAKMTIDLPPTSQTSDVDFYITASSGQLSHDFKLHLRIIGDQSPPEIERTYPEADAENIPPEAPILVWFSEPIDPQTLTKDSFSIIEDESGTEYTGNIDYEEQTNVLMISNIVEDLGSTASSPKGLPYNKLVKVTLEKSIMDLAGNKLTNKYQFKYLTLKKATPVGIDPKIEYVYPTKDATGIPYNTPLVIKFSIPMNSSTLNWNTITITCDGGKKYSGTLNYNADSKTLTITEVQTTDNMQLGFMNDSKVTVTLDTGIKTVADKPLTSAYSWSFTVGATVLEEEEEDEGGINNETLAIILLIIIIIIIVLLFLGSASSKKREEPEEEEPVDERIEMEEPEEEELEEEIGEEVEDEFEEKPEEGAEEELEKEPEDELEDELKEKPKKTKKVKKE